MDEILKTAKSCRHYAMCKIDYLGNGVCASGLEKQYVSFYPQGRMDLYAALVEQRIPVTEKGIEIANSCDLCGICDYQCYFITEMQPTKVMHALKKLVSDFLVSGGKVVSIQETPLLKEIRNIVGPMWVSNDPAIRITYSDDPCPLAPARMPEYVVMPGSSTQIVSLVQLFQENKIPYAVRGNGSSVMGFVMSTGVVIDLNRMKSIAFDEKNWLVKVGPGVAAFDLQREAQKRGYRVNVAEPSALVCANLMCSGIFSTFSAGYGTAADNYVTAEFVSPEGNVFSAHDKASPNLFSFSHAGGVSPGICTSVSVKLHPVLQDETGILIPFETVEKALDFTRECAQRRIGIAIGMLGVEYIATFLAPTKKNAAELREAFGGRFNMQFLVLVIGDRFAVQAIEQMGYPFIGEKLFRILCLGMPALNSPSFPELLNELSEGEPFSYLRLKHFTDVAEAALQPSPSHAARDMIPELRPFFEKLYAQPHLTDLVWLNMFRIVSARMGREKHLVALILYTPIDAVLITEIIRDFRRIADEYKLKNDFGFITPLDNGKRCVFEYDYYADHTDPDESERMRQAVAAAGTMIETYTAKTGTVKWIRYVFLQGFSRKEHFLYT